MNFDLAATVDENRPSYARLTMAHTGIDYGRKRAKTPSMITLSPKHQTKGYWAAEGRRVSDQASRLRPVAQGRLCMNAVRLVQCMTLKSDYPSDSMLGSSHVGTATLPLESTHNLDRFRVRVRHLPS